MSFWSQAAKLVGAQPHQAHTPNATPTSRDLIRLESRIGATVFGPLPPDRERQFFYLDNCTWIWYEQWPGNDKKPQSVTTRYEIRPTGVLKIQDNEPYAVLEGAELRNLLLAVRQYYERTTREVYHLNPTTGQPEAQSGN